jgi:hypothetical protein
MINPIYSEPGQELPLNTSADVVVCGGGPAGIAAALSAARAGARTRLFEWRGCLGGIWTAGLLGYLLDFDKPGIARELADHLTARGARQGVTPWEMIYDPEAMKLLLEDLLVEAGVEFQLHTRVAAAYREGRRLTTIVTESKSGRQAWQAPVFIDATGDGDLGHLAGNSWVLGDERSPIPRWQPLSLNALLLCRDASALAAFLHDSDGNTSHRQGKQALGAEFARAGFSTSYGSPTLWQIRDNLLLVMLNHEYDIKPFDAAAITQATVRARRELHAATAALRKLGGPWEGLQIAATAEQIGVRDGRRLVGYHTVTREDLVSGARHADAVVRSTLPVDIHGAGKGTDSAHNGGVRARPFDIPLRALIAREVDGLLMAGRCISGDFIAHGSYRVTGNAVAMGEAVGLVAAIAAETRTLPHEIPWAEVAARRTSTHPAYHAP